MAKHNSADDIMKLIKDEKVEYVDIRFCDLPGVMQHFTIPAAALTEAVFEDGLAFDGSSIGGWKGIEASDMLLMPDPGSARMRLDQLPEHLPRHRPTAAGNEQRVAGLALQDRAAAFGQVASHPG